MPDLTVTQLAKRAGITGQGIRYKIQTGEIVACRDLFTGDWRITADAAERFLREYQSAGDGRIRFWREYREFRGSAPRAETVAA